MKCKAIFFTALFILSTLSISFAQRRHSMRVAVDRWELITGLMYSNPGFRTDDKSELVVRNIINGNAMSMKQAGLNVRRHYLEIPTMIRHVVGFANRCHSYAEFGVHHQFYQTSNHERSEQDPFRFVEVQKKYHVSGQFNIGSRFAITDNFQVFSQLNMSYQFTTLYQEGYQDRNTGIGFTIGGRYLI